MADSIKVKGRVFRKRVDTGSKSERDAVCIQTARGAEHILRRMGGNAFQDPELERLIGEEIEGEGRLTGQTLVLTSYRLAEPKK